MNIDEFLAKKAELEETLKKHGEGMLRTLFGEFFAAAPEIKTIAWTQYTPYFNDGDACVFGVNDPVFYTEYPEDVEDFSYYEGEIETYKNPNPVIKDFSKKFYGAKDVLETLGDHSEITVTNRADGVRIVVEEHSHD